MKYSIIIPTYNNCPLLKNCIESVIKNSNLEDTEIIVISNGCKDGTWVYLNSLHQIKKIRFFDPIGFPKAVNVGIQQAEGEYIVLLNNDTIIMDWGTDWLKMLEKPFTESSKMGVTGVSKLKFVPRIKNTLPPQDVINEAGGSFILFFCAMFKKSLVYELGLLDEAFTPGIGEDVDFCFRAQRKGYELQTVPQDDGNWKYNTGFPICHISGQSFGNMHGQFEKSMELLTKRWNEGYYRPLSK